MNNNNESPFGNPRFLAAIAVTFFCLWGWQYYISQKYPPSKAPTQQAEAVNSTAGVTEKNNISNADVAEKVSDSKTDNKAASLTDGSAPAIIEEKTFLVETKDVKFEVSSKGMGLKNYTLKSYTNRKGQPINFTTEDAQAEILVNQQIVNFNIEQTSEFNFTGTAVVDGKKISRKLIFDPSTLSLVSEIEFEVGFDSIQTKLFQKHQQPENTNFFMPSFEQQDFVYVEGKSTQSEHISGLKPGEGFIKTSPGATLASVGTQYFTAAIINKSDIVPNITNKVENNMASVAVNYNLKDTKVGALKQVVYLGPKKTEELNKIDSLLPEVMNYGMFGFISKPLMKLLAFLHSILGNWGFAIIALTLIVRTILLPFNIMSFRSAQAMQRIKPQMDAVRERYKDDPIRMNKETMDLMKNNNANPLSGCLPMLLQLPVFFALWKTIGSSIEIYQQPFMGWISDLSYHDPFFVFPILMGITMYLQQKMTPTTMDPMQAKILNFMPILFTLFMLTLPSGLTLYNFVSALFGVTQQYFLLKDNKAGGTQVAKASR